MPSEFDSKQAIKNAFTNMKADDLYKQIDDRYTSWLDHTAGMRNQWRLNSLFAQGFQWATLQPSQNKIIMPPTSRHRKRITLNLIKPWLLDTEAKLDIALPTFDVTPNSTSQMNKDAAKAGESYGQHLWRQLEMRQKYRVIVRHCEHFGGCFGVLDWDETIGPLYSQRQQLPDEASAGQAMDEMFTLGDLRYDIFSPDNVVTDEEDTDMDEKPYVILASWMSLDNIRERWDDGHNLT